jgi:UDP-N-acetylglucosamine--N-acetylmuramyl-(pentapeptide) pyrophosphoryl-undecaprenol N-acetylglucosamine transferase
VTGTLDGPGHVHLAASGGGHLDLLRRVGPVFAGVRRTWVTTPGQGADDLRQAGERVLTLPPFDRRNRGAGNLRRAVGLVIRERPELVVTSGAGVVVAFCAAARLAGARVLFAETMARVCDSSLSGRILARLAGLTLVQWPEMRAVHPRAVVCRPALLDDVAAAPPGPGSGTFVALGTHHQPFDRLLALVDGAATAGVLPRPIRAQAGASAGFASALPDSELARWMAPGRIDALLRDSAVVVAHAGAGIVSSALRHGRRPIVLPRLTRYGEHVDDHQLQLAEKLAAMDLAIHARVPITLDAVEAARRPVEPPAWPPRMPSLADALRDAVG